MSGRAGGGAAARGGVAVATRLIGQEILGNVDTQTVIATADAGCVAAARSIAVLLISLAGARENVATPALVGVLGSGNGEALGLASSNARLRGEGGGFDALGPGESTAQIVEIVDVAAAVSVVGDGDLAGGLGVSGILPDVEGALATAELGLVTIARVIARGVGGLVSSDLVTAVADTVVSETGIAESVALADGGTLLDSQVAAINLGAHNESCVSIGIAALAGERGVVVGTGGKLIVGGGGEGGQRQDRGSSHDRPAEGHGERVPDGVVRVM